MRIKESNNMELYAKFTHNGSDKHDWSINILPSVMLGNQVYFKGYELTVKWILWTFRVGLMY